ncbi:MAG: endo alpha-1,4 polygalactosaminidase [Cocleimonas sp.]|nr:endo alpha-1,4 polygalactosaminidase [Cocleimonas sp.]
MAVITFVYIAQATAESKAPQDNSEHNNDMKEVIKAVSKKIGTLTKKGADNKSTAVFYGANLPTHILSQYKRIIVEPDNVKQKELLALTSEGSRVFAYVSIGEVNPSRKWYKKIKPAWVLGDNKIWDSKVMDLASLGWQDFLVDTVVKKLWDNGYRGLFLDTMDSFYIFAKDKKQQEKQTDALTALMKKINKRYPEMRFISNRGFEVLPSIGKQLEAVVAESLYASWDNGKKIYKETPANDQEWLLNKLNGIKNDLSVDIIIIDYAKPGDRTKAKLIADKITKQGFIPWISIPSLDLAGVGSIEPTLDTYLLLTDSKIDGHNPLKLKKYQKLVEMLKGKNKKLKVHDIRLGMPLGHMPGCYTAIISALPSDKQSKAYIAWLKKQKEEGVILKRHP